MAVLRRFVETKNLKVLMAAASRQAYQSTGLPLSASVPVALDGYFGGFTFRTKTEINWLSKAPFSYFNQDFQG